MKKALLWLLCISLNVGAYTPSDKSKISILTCSPGDQVYSVYGHSAIRFHDSERDVDIVYNYGMFDFSAPHFVWRYLRGENEYLLGRESFSRFRARYERENQTVKEQVINLTLAETQVLFVALEDNAKPENRNYLYNVFYDNCATRIYHIVEDNITGGIIWPTEYEEASFRTLMHKTNYLTPYSQMGIDMVFGLKADNNVSCKDQMYLPSKLEEHISNAKRTNGQALISKSNLIVKANRDKDYSELILFNGLFIALCLASILARKKQGKFLKIFKVSVYVIIGLASLIVWFIDFCSIHPTVLPNLNIIWINPFWMVLAILEIKQKRLSTQIQKILNVWCIVNIVLALLSLTSLYYLHYGVLYTVFILSIVSFRGYNKQT